jgi:hypothetical protein
MFVVIALVILKYYLVSLLAFIALIGFVPVLALTASYYIESDQFHLRYRKVEGTAYLIFPGQWPLLNSMANSFAGDHLIKVTYCGDAKVASLPLLPYKPLLRQKDVIDEVGFRRFPDLQFEGIELTVGVETGQASLSDGKHRRSLGFQVGVASTGPATISLTSIFPRSLRCLKNQVPLLPILEVLPWDPNETSSLIKAAIKINQFRKIYPNGIISIDNLLRLRINGDENQYKSLMDFLVYSLAYQAFAGNVFAEARADFANNLCIIAENRKNAFSGPFSSLPENFLWRMVSEMGPKYQLAAPACRVSDDLLKSYQESISSSNPTPFYETFKKCIETATSIAKCLAEDDAPERKPACDTSHCNSFTHRNIPDEEVFEIFDEKFSAVVATSDNTLLDIATAEPDKCPTLRDSEEEDYFVTWWIDRANTLMAGAARCSSQEWQEKYALSRKVLRNARACASQKHVRSARHEEGVPDSAQLLYEMKCGGNVGMNQTVIMDQLYGFYDGLGLLVSKLKGYSTLIPNPRIDRLIDAFQMFEKIKRDICGPRDSKKCMDEYAVWQNYQRLFNKVFADLGLSNVDSAPQIISALTSLNNVIVDMVICDLLQDKEFGKDVGLDRDVYCDDNGLREYRLIGSGELGQSIERTEESSNGSIGYWYSSHGAHSRDMGIKLFLGK